MRKQAQPTWLRDNKIVVFLRDKSPYYQARIKIEGQPYIYKSLKTMDREKALRAAQDFYVEARYKFEHGLNIRPRRFKTVANEFLRLLADEVTAGKSTKRKLQDYRLVFERYFIPYFGNKQIDEISEVDIHRYQDWRDRYWSTGEGASVEYLTYQRRHGKTGEMQTVKTRHRRRNNPSTRTHHLEATYLRAIFRHARRMGYIKAHRIPEIKVKRVQSNRRPHFEIGEYRTLIRKSAWRCRKAPKNAEKERRLLHDWVLIMANTGMRPVEAKNLRWRDVDYVTAEDGTTIVRLWVSGKGKQRDLVAMPRTRIYLERLRERNAPKSDDEYVFCLPGGHRVESFKNSFTALLEDAGLLYDRHGRKRVPYSLRHTYATLALLYGRVNVYTLAVNMGTSVEMIERHYGHVKPLQAHKELTARFKL